MRRFAGLMFGALALALACAAPSQADMAACRSASVKKSVDDKIRLYTICIEGGDMRRTDLAGAYNNRGVAYLEKGEVDLAYTDFDRSVRYDPKFGVALANRARTRLQRGEPEAALADLKAAVKLPPSRIRGDAYFLAAQIELSLGRPADALASLEEAMGYARKAPEPRNLAAWILATAPDAGLRDGARAVELAEKAEKLADGAWPIQDTLAAAYAEAGRLDEAAAVQERAIALAREAGVPESRLAALGERLELYRSGQPYRDLAPARPGPAE